MQTIYCTHCGSKNIYSGSKPKFCSSCGASISGDSSPPKKSILPKAEKVTESRIESDDTTDIDYVPQLSSLAYELENDGTIGYANHKLIDLVDVREIEQKEKSVKIQKRRKK